MGPNIIRRLTTVLCAVALVAGCQSAERPPAEPAAPTPEAAAITAIVEAAIRDDHLRAVLVQVSVDGEQAASLAFGESMTGVPATTDMHFRNGAVAISYVSTLLLLLAEDGVVGLDDPLSTWLPDVPHADRVTLRQLAQMTSGYPDYVLGNEAFEQALLDDPFRQWSPEELLAFALDKPLLYPPGTNWNYAHTDYVLLGLAMEKATGRSVADLLDERVLGPLGLTDTADSATPQIPEPALHAFSSERRAALGVPPNIPFIEESTYWNPSWTITRGAVQTTTIGDMEASAAGIGSGRLLSEDSYRQMVSTHLRGTTRAQPGCATCMAQSDGYTYGLGIVISGDWLMQNPLFSGYAGVMAYLPQRRIAIAVAVTFAPEAFDPTGDYDNAADGLFRRIAAALAPEYAPPMPPDR